MDENRDYRTGLNRRFTITYLGETLYAGPAVDMWDAMAKIPTGHKVNSLTVAISPEVERGSGSEGWDGMLHVVEDATP